MTRAEPDRVGAVGFTPMTASTPSILRRRRAGRAPFLPAGAGRRRALAILATLALALAACGGGSAILSAVGSSVDDQGGTGSPAEQPAAATAAPAPYAADEQDGAAFRAASGVDAGPLIVRTGQLNLEVATLDEALAAAEQAVAAAGGYVAASQRSGDEDRASATVTYRIPVERWEATLAALRKVGTKVLSEQTASEEVTSQVVDLGARLVNLRATETALQAIMTKATKIPDILEVQAQLSSVRQEIEQLTAQKQALEERAALATLAVGFSLPPVVAVAQVREGWDPAKQVDEAAATLVGIGQGVASAMIWAGIVLLPLALLLGIGIGIAWLIVRRVRPRSAAPLVPPTGPAEEPAA